MATSPIPAYVPSPGETILDELEARGMGLAELGQVSSNLPEIAENIINEKGVIDEEAALLLGRAFGISSNFWLNLEHNYRTYIRCKFG